MHIVCMVWIYIDLDLGWGRAASLHAMICVRHAGLPHQHRSQFSTYTETHMQTHVNANSLTIVELGANVLMLKDPVPTIWWSTTTVQQSNSSATAVCHILLGKGVWSCRLTASVDIKVGSNYSGHIAAASEPFHAYTCDIWPENDNTSIHT